MSSMRAYLAEKYMSGPKADAILARTAPQKKKKRKGAASQPISNVRDDDAEWTDQGKEDDDIAEAVIASDRGFKKRRVTAVGEESGWTTVQEPEPPSTPPPLADEQPLLVESAPAFVGGLMTSEQLLGRLPQENLPADLSVEAMAAAQETVYRDTSGRKIDTKAERAEAARRKREAEEREAQKMEWGKGLVQREEQEQRKLELEKQKTTKFARHVDDKELNEEMRSREHWNDPAAAFLTKKGSKGPRKPEYTGPTPAPNRFGIKPGYRWDGVDRSNGFEKKFFQRANERHRKKHESHAWSVEDM